MATTTVYSASAVNMVYGGHVITGFGSGDDVVLVERASAGVTQVVGMQGDTTISQSTDKSGTITIKLLAGSESNTFLSAKANAADSGAVFAAPIVITEVGSDAKVTANKCVIEMIPAYGRGASANEVEWKFISGDIAITHSGAEDL